MLRTEYQRHIGKYVRFRTPYGYHEGVIERIQGDQVIILSPQQYIPPKLALEPLDAEEAKRLDLALTFGGYGVAREGHGGYGWGRWAISFLIIYLLWGLLLW